ncbi:MAG: hypothetical protein ACKOPT_14535 [Cyanobium sp.]
MPPLSLPVALTGSKTGSRSGMASPVGCRLCAGCGGVDGFG